MKQSTIFLVSVAVAAAIIIGGISVYKNKQIDTHQVVDRPVIATTIVPLTVMVKNLVGDTADVQSVLPHGAEPHDVTLSPKELGILQQAQVVVKLGLGLDTWVDKGLASTGNQAQLIQTADYLGLPGGMQDPHVWLSPQRMIIISDRLAEALENAMPQAADEIRARAAAYHTTLAAVDAEYKTLAILPHRDIVTLHAAFGYLAQDYGLHVAGVIEQVPEDSPSATQVAAIIQELKRYPTVPLFGESELQPAILQSIAHDTGRTVHILDPIESSAVALDTYQVIMRKNLATLTTALSVGE